MKERRKIGWNKEEMCIYKLIIVSLRYAITNFFSSTLVTSLTSYRQYTVCLTWNYKRHPRCMQTSWWRIYTLFTLYCPWKREPLFPTLTCTFATMQRITPRDLILNDVSIRHIILYTSASVESINGSTILFCFEGDIKM